MIFLSGPGSIPRPRPSKAPVQMHMARPDPFDDEAFVAAWAAADGAAPLEVCRYDRVGHDFLDEAGPNFHAAAAEACTARLGAFLDRL